MEICSFNNSHYKKNLHLRVFCFVRLMQMCCNNITALCKSYEVFTSTTVDRVAMFGSYCVAMFCAAMFCAAMVCVAIIYKLYDNLNIQCPHPVPFSLYVCFRNSSSWWGDE